MTDVVTNIHKRFEHAGYNRWGGVGGARLAQQHEWMGRLTSDT